MFEDIDTDDDTQFSPDTALDTYVGSDDKIADDKDMYVIAFYGK